MSKVSNTTLQAITSGKFATIQWVKNNGEVRTVRALYGVKKYLKPGAIEKHDQTKYILVWTRQDGEKRYNAPRLIRRDSILGIRAEGYDVRMNPRSDYAKTIKA